MKVLVVYDSIHGNTETIARAITGGFGEAATLMKASEAAAGQLNGIDLLILGAPPHGGRPTPEMLQFLGKLDPDTVSGMKAAAFDTRLSTKWVGIFGYAAGRIGGALKRMGAELVANPEPFFVTGTEGPLREGEEKRAEEWAKAIAATKTSA
jgi:flavodoxin